jgi:hypothetical protein
MSIQTQTEQAQALKAGILSQSVTDFEFRQELLNNPRAAIAKFVGVDSSALPEEFNLTFTEQDGVGGVRLPEYAGANAEIADAELEAVSGGTAILIVPILQMIDWYNEDSQCKA